MMAIAHAAAVGAQQFYGLAHLRGLGKAMELGKQGNGIDKTMLAGNVFDQVTPGQPLHPGHGTSSVISLSV